MIPLKLQLRNFLSYGDQGQTVDFAPYSLICLSGKNGHGKSAMLDAMTWAVWGQARKIGNVARADEGLLRLGARSMCVVFDFMCGGATYRVRRELALTNAGKPYTNLDFGLIGDDSAPKSLTEKTIRQTQETIERIVGLTFDSFVNSVFLRQGQSNEFSKKSAKERKEILTSILGVDAFETVREKALERIRRSVAERDSFGKLLERLGAEVARAQAVREQVAQVCGACDQLSARQQELAVHSQQAMQVRARQAEHMAQAKVLESACAHTREQVQQVVSEVRQVYAQWRQVHYARIRCVGSQPHASQLAVLREQEAQLRHLAQQYAQASQQLAESEKQLAFVEQQRALNHERALAAVAVECASIGQEYKQAQAEVAQLQTRLAQMALERTNLERQMREIAQERSACQARVDRFIAARRVLEKQKEVCARVTAQVERVERGCSQVRSQLVSLDVPEQSQCPLCLQTLAHARAQTLRQQLQSTELFYQHRHRRLTAFVATWQPVIKDGECTVQADEQAGMVGERLKERQEQAGQRLAELAVQAHAGAAELERARERERQVRQRHSAKQTEHEGLLESGIACDPDIAKLRAVCQAHEQARAALGYDAAVHEQVRAQLEAAEQQSAREQELVEQQNQQGQRLKHIHMLVHSARSLTMQLAGQERELAQLSQAIAQQDRAQQEGERIRAEYDGVSQQLQQLQAVRARAEHDLERLESVMREHEQYAARVKELEKDIYQYRAISAALGKDGIQALLIEAVIPELESEANALLGRLTDNNAQIFIESLRDLKSGGTRETLDINISDNAGIRPYELFSGGEAFRIDFALRVAISKLLARRAGATLQTLIIDEGFGSQDEDGLSRVMDALYRVQDDFAKIIVVSHLEALKQQFPVQMIVEKGPLGSQVSVFEQE